MKGFLELKLFVDFANKIKRNPGNHAVHMRTEFELTFSFPRRLLILLQRRKKYKTRTILGYKTLAEGIIRMDGVLQKSADMNVELTESAKNGRSGLPVATLRAIQVTSSPVDQDNKNNNSVLISGKCESLPAKKNAGCNL